MATIVQPYNPWREQLAMGFLGPLVMQNIQRNQQAADNRLKARALMEAMNGAVGAQDNAPLFDATGAPQTSDPWAKSFWGNEGAGNLAGFNGGVSTPAQPARTAGWGDLWGVLANNRQYGAQDPKEMAALFAPYLQEQAGLRQAEAAAEAARQKQSAMDAYMSGLDNVSEPMALMKYLTRGAGQGFVGQNEFGDWVNFLKSRNKEYKSENLGDRIMSMSFDPVSGELTPVWSGATGATPGQRMDNALGYAKLDETRDYHQGQSAIGWANVNETERHHRATESKDNTKLIQDAEGNYVRVDMNTGQVTEVKNAKGETVKGQPKVGADRGQWTEKDQIGAKINQLNAKIKQKEKELNTLIDGIWGTPTQEQLAQEQALREEINSLYNAQNDLIDGKTLTLKQPQQTQTPKPPATQTPEPPTDPQLDVLNGTVKGESLGPAMRGAAGQAAPAGQAPTVTRVALKKIADAYYNGDINLAAQAARKDGYLISD